MIRVLAFLAAMAGCAACATGRPAAISAMNAPPCRSGASIAWAGPGGPDRVRLSDWCQSVGPPIVRTPPLDEVDVSRTGLVVLTWNVHDGHGDLEQLLRSLQGGPAAIVLLQEVARAGDDIPAGYPLTVKAPGRIGPTELSGRDIAVMAGRLQMSLAYVPSMRNGSDVRQDRGCAILSTLPLSDIVGVELPWVTQRRVAVMATVTARNGSVPWRLRIVNVHLDNRPGRSAQSAALADFLERVQRDGMPIVAGGDLNAWFGTGDRAVRALERVVPLATECGDAATFRFGRRLDHLFTTLPHSARSGCAVGRDRFGSDHRPLVLSLFQSGPR